MSLSNAESETEGKRQQLETDILNIAIVWHINRREDLVVLNELSYHHNPITLNIVAETPNTEEFTVRKT